MANLITLNKATKDLWRALSCCSLLLLCTRPLVAQAPSLTFDTVPFGNTGQIAFKTFPSATVRPSPAASQELYSYETDDHKFVIVVNPDTITSVPRYSAFTFDASVKRQGGNDAVWYLYNVRADPVGQFADVLKNVSFKILDGPNGSSVGSVKLPIHSAVFDADLLRDKNEPPVLEIKVSDSQGPTISFENALDGLAIHLTKVEVRSKCDKCWEIDGKPQTLDQNIGPLARQSIPLQIKPRAMSAMLATAFILKPEKPQDTLTVTLSYNVDEGGMPKDKQFEIPVRFRPVLWQLALATVAGGILGVILKCVLAPQPSKPTLGALATQVFLVAPVAVFIAAVAASYETKVEILSFDLDPRQVIPAGLLAFVVTGGPTVTKWAVGLFRQTRTATPQNGSPAVTKEGIK